MSFDQLLTHVNHVPLASLDALSRDVWRRVGEGSLTESQAQTLAEAIHKRRRPYLQDSAPPPECLRTGSGAPGAAATKIPRPWSYFPAKRPQRSPDKAKSLERRRTLAASGPLPPKLACNFTTGELAVLKIVADEVVAQRQCTLSIDEIAARAGVGRTKARMSLKIARDLGLLSITERRVNYKPNLSNVVRIISSTWETWLDRWKPRTKGPKKTDGDSPGSAQTPRTPARSGGEAVPAAPGGEGSLLRRPRNQGFTRKAG